MQELLGGRMINDVPQWLVASYVRSVQNAGSTLSKEELTEACNTLIERWSSPERHYHNLQHVIDTLTRVETLTTALHSPDLVNLAVWYHGIIFSLDDKDIYTRNGGEDEYASAQLAQKELHHLEVTKENCDRIAELICSLRERTTNASSTTTAKFQAIDVDVLALKDAHFGCLAVEPQRYRTYVDQIRAEYATVSDLAFCTARRAIIHNLLHRRPLFITPLARTWEETARGNLEAEQERLMRRLKDMEADISLPTRLSQPIQPLTDLPLAPHSPHQIPLASAPTTGAQTMQFSAITAEFPETSPTAATPSFTDATPAETVEEEAETRKNSPANTSIPSGPAEKTQSTLEAISDRLEGRDTGSHPSNETAEERKKRRREEIAEQMRKRVTERQRTTGEMKKIDGDELRPQGVSGVSAPSADFDDNMDNITPTRVHDTRTSPTYPEEPILPGKIYVAPTAESPSSAPAPASAISALTAEDYLDNQPSSGMEREPKE